MTDWETLRRAYLSGEGSYQALARRYGVSVDAIKRRGGKEHWVQQRQTQREMAAAPAEETVPRQEPDWAPPWPEEEPGKEKRRRQALRLGLLDLACRWVEQQRRQGGIGDVKEYRSMVQSLADLGDAGEEEAPAREEICIRMGEETRRYSA
mgnify:FL=1